MLQAKVWLTPVSAEGEKNGKTGTTEVVPVGFSR